MNTRKLCQVAAISMTLLVGAGATTGTASADPVPPEDVYSEITDADIADPNAIIIDSPADMEAAKTANQAVAWFAARKGSTAYQGYCERAVRLSWARKTRHASAIAHWRSSDGTRRTTGTPPKGAFVFWNISKYGHVGIADGAGGVWATSVKGRIGHAKRSYFRNYLGWKTGNSN
ncbi:CHAP domain-containing protein [Streptosporangium sp. NPDC050855]|uniref:CHAP domain-containing protein n=1 Tax=Streptosporangium sp. NPDC050855 TaxID=3366194 RepID=UPI0037AE7979